MPADTELLLGEPGRPATLRTVLHDATPTPYHYAEVTGLEPGRTYAYVARSAGQAAAQTSLQFPGRHGSLDVPGVVTTLATPPGRYLFTVALAGDTHIGETVSGVIAADWPQAFRQDPGLPPYPEVMLTGMLADLRAPAVAPAALIVAGDITAEAAPRDVARARATSRRMGAARHGLLRGTRQPRPPAHRRPLRGWDARPRHQGPPRLLG